MPTLPQGRSLLNKKYLHPRICCHAQTLSGMQSGIRSRTWVLFWRRLRELWSYSGTLDCAFCGTFYFRCLGYYFIFFHGRPTFSHGLGHRFAPGAAPFHLSAFPVHLDSHVCEVGGLRLAFAANIYVGFTFKLPMAGSKRPLPGRGRIHPPSLRLPADGWASLASDAFSGLWPLF